MDQHETHGTSRTDVLDTIALGSMLVFASVMPPLAGDPAESGARRAGAGGHETSRTLDSGKAPARRLGGRFGS